MFGSGLINVDALLVNRPLLNIAPINTVTSVIPGDPVVGEESEVDDGEWKSTTAITFSYQWQLNGADIIGATAKTLLYLIGMVGQALTCLVKATNKYGFSVSIAVVVVI